MAKEKDVKKKIKKEKEVKKTKQKFGASLRKELKQVKWPTFKEVVKYTIATIIFIVVFVAFFELLNILMAFVKGLFN